MAIKDNSIICRVNTDFVIEAHKVSIGSIVIYGDMIYRSLTAKIGYYFNICLIDLDNFYPSPVRSTL